MNELEVLCAWLAEDRFRRLRHKGKKRGKRDRMPKSRVTNLIHNPHLGHGQARHCAQTSSYTAVLARIDSWSIAALFATTCKTARSHLRHGGPGTGATRIRSSRFLYIRLLPSSFATSMLDLDSPAKVCVVIPTGLRSCGTIRSPVIRGSELEDL